MCAQAIANWTVMIYVNGNNELEPEICQSLQDLLRVRFDESNMNILVQVGREDRELARIVRPFESFGGSGEVWTGVKRYKLSNNLLLLLEDMEKLNMADPKSLYMFIIWCMERCPAKHYALILGGHGASYIGAINDYSSVTPYMMGTTEMCKAINLIMPHTGNRIDLLLLDMCYMNYIEILYELGSQEDHTVENVVTYIEEGPLEGLALDHVIGVLDRHLQTEDLESLIKEMVDSLGAQLVAVRLNPKKLERIKYSSNRLANEMVKYSEENPIRPDSILHTESPPLPYKKSIAKVLQELNQLAFYHTAGQTGNLPVNIMTMSLNELFPVYYKLKFARNNSWSSLLGLGALHKYRDTHINIRFEPSPVTKSGVLMLIMSLNPHLDEWEARKILRELYRYKKWNWNE